MQGVKQLKSSGMPSFYFPRKYSPVIHPGYTADTAVSDNFTNFTITAQCTRTKTGESPRYMILTCKFTTTGPLFSNSFKTSISTSVSD